MAEGEIRLRDSCARKLRPHFPRARPAESGLGSVLNWVTAPFKENQPSLEFNRIVAALIRSI